MIAGSALVIYGTLNDSLGVSAINSFIAIENFNLNNDSRYHIYGNMITITLGLTIGELSESNWITVAKVSENINMKSTAFDVMLRDTRVGLFDSFYLRDGLCSENEIKIWLNKELDNSKSTRFIVTIPFTYR